MSICKITELLSTRVPSKYIQLAELTVGGRRKNFFWKTKEQVVERDGVYDTRIAVLGVCVCKLCGRSSGG